MDIFKGIKWVMKSLFPTTEWNFYPLANTSYWVPWLTRTDYIKLYTSRQYVAISTIANSIAELEKSLTRTKNDDKQIQHKHFQLLSYDLLVQIVSSLQLTWSCYLYKNMIGKTIDSLEFLRTDLVTIEENEDWSVKQYRYNSKNRSILFNKADIIDISLYSPIKTYPYTVKWVSPMQAVAIQAEMDSTANRRNRNFFKNGASAGDVFTTDKVINEESKSRFLSKWKSEFQWVNNSHKVAILDSWLTYSKVGITQKELDFVETRRFTRDEVFAIFKVPQSILWVTENSNRASALVAENTYYRICIRPLARMLEETFNKELFAWIGYFSFTNIVPADTEALLADFNAGAITLNEYRQERWFQQLKDWDTLKNSNIFGSEPMPQVETEEQKSKFAETIHNTIMKHIKWTHQNRKARREEWSMKRQKKIQRTDRYEIKYIDKIKEMFVLILW